MKDMGLSASCLWARICVCIILPTLQQSAKRFRPIPTFYWLSSYLDRQAFASKTAGALDTLW